MIIEEQIINYIDEQPEAKRIDLHLIHKLILKLSPNCKLWFLDGRNNENKIVSNPNIGYGIHTINYANGSSKEFYNIGLSANSSGISVYIFGNEDKSFLADTFGNTIGKAKVTGYCIKFKSLKDINIAILEDAIKIGFMHGDSLK